MQHSLTIIVPIYNEVDNLQRVQQELGNYCEHSNIPTQILLIDDGSTDGSIAVIKQICQDNSKFDYIQFDGNYGLSAAIKAGFDAVKTTLVGYIDADLQTNPQDFNLLLEYIEDYQLITGTRSLRKDSQVKNWSSQIANSIRRAFTNDGVDDTGCPLKILHSNYAKRIPMFRGLHRFLPAMILLQQGKVKQVPVRHYPRVAGEAKFGLRNRLVGPLVDCFAYLWMKKKYINYKIEKTSYDE